MIITIARTTFTDKSTIGSLFIDGEWLCYTLEDTCRESAPGTWVASMKVPERTAIPYGTYPVVITWSSRFKKPLPLLLNVPDFTGVRIHSGNRPQDTEGCLLVGQMKGQDFVGQSRAAMEILFGKIQKAILKEKVHLTIESAISPSPRTEFV